MKKLLFAILVFATCSFASAATDELQIIPKGVSSATVARTTYAFIQLNNPSSSDAVLNMQFEIKFPSDWTIGDLDIEGTTSVVFDRFQTTETVTEEVEDEDGNITYEEVTKTTKHFVASSKLQDDGYVKFVYYSKDNKPLVGSAGYIGRIKFTVPAGTADGYYPITLKEGGFVSTSGSASGKHTFGETTSYVRVGTAPADGSLALTSIVPSFVVTQLNKETALTSLNLEGVSTINTPDEGYALVDGRTIVAPEGGLKVDKATYTRTVSGYGSLELPFDVTEGGTFYTTKVTAAPADGGYVHFDADTELPANTAAIIKDETVNVSTTNFTITSVAPKTITTGYYVKSDGIYKVNKSAVINPYRASWDFGSAVKGFTFGDDATGISTVELDENGSIYDLNGRKLNKAGRGVNIINGQKILKK